MSLIPTNTSQSMRTLERKAGRKCIDCDREAQHKGAHREGGWSPLWCQPCDEDRIARITASLEEISRSFKAIEARP